jgi:hypothetical protein
MMRFTIALGLLPVLGILLGVRWAWRRPVRTPSTFVWGATGGGVCGGAIAIWLAVMLRGPAGFAWLGLLGAGLAAGLVTGGVVAAWWAVVRALSTGRFRDPAP